ncbi:MAG: TIGR03560 family F420-dependent LLM class oxidoreductase [Actinobacteria bacterium]|nr:TIGR03560 family F420-dependent LLM class oxidoreductase [Actinomycetota bacterium]
MKFAFATAPQVCTWQEMLDIWTAADAIPFWESGWTFDHFEPIFTGDRSGPCMEGWITLTALLQATKRLRGGVMVTGMVYRHPAVLANMAATLDHTSGGRLEFGVGAAWNEDECNAYGIELGTMTERFDRFAEGLEVIKLMLTQKQSSFNGKYFTLTDAYCEPKPIQQPMPPVLIGGGGMKRTLPLVAQYADHWNFPGNSEDPLGDLKKSVARLKECCDEIGRDISTIRISTQLWVDRMSEAEAIERAHAYEDAGVSLAIVSLPRPLNVKHIKEYPELFASVWK